MCSLASDPNGLGTDLGLHATQSTSPLCRGTAHSGLNCRPCIRQTHPPCPSCPRMIPASTPDATSQTRTDLSHAALASTLASVGWNATALTAAECPSIGATPGSPVRASHTRTA
eukprot:1639226-Rhodomonas_salina.3